MSSSQAIPAPPQGEQAPRPLWTASLTGRARGLALAREKYLLLAWDERHWLMLLNRKGDVQGRIRAEGPLAVACAADDGSALAAVGARGEVWWLSPDLMPRWKRVLPHPAVAVAQDMFGQYVAATDARGGLHLFDRDGRAVLHVTCLRPLHQLAFVPEAPLLIGAADFGLVVGYDFAGHCVWRDGPVANLGSLAVSGDGSRVVVACFSEGLRFYDRSGAKRGNAVLDEAVQHVAMSYDGRLLLAGGRGKRVLLLGGDGHLRHAFPIEDTAVALALDALGERALVALADGRIVALDTSAFASR